MLLQNGENTKDAKLLMGFKDQPTCRLRNIEGRRRLMLKRQNTSTFYKACTGMLAHVKNICLFTVNLFDIENGKLAQNLNYTGRQWTATFFVSCPTSFAISSLVRQHFLITLAACWPTKWSCSTPEASGSWIQNIWLHYIGRHNLWDDCNCNFRLHLIKILLMITPNEILFCPKQHIKSKSLTLTFLSQVGIRIIASFHFCKIIKN